MSKHLSIIIPTYGRERYLAETLGVLFDQTPSKDEYEVLVIDRPVDNTRGVVGSFAKDFPIKYLRQDGVGRPQARNIGIREAKGEILLFLDDDILIQEGLIEGHLKSHSKFPKMACLGHTINTTKSNSPFVRYLVEDSTFLTAYELIKNPEDIPFNLFYTSNISIPRMEALRVGLFDEDFSRYGLEDLEFGYRWTKAGYGIRYNPEAVGYHHYDTTKEEFFQRRHEVGQAAAIFYKKHQDDPRVLEYLHIDVVSRLTPGSNLIIEKAKEIVEAIEDLSLEDDIFGTQGIRKTLHSCYSLLIAYHYYQGLKEGLKDQNIEQR